MSGDRKQYGFMSLPRSTYYYRPRMPAEEVQKKAADLRDRIEAIVQEFPR